LRDLSRVELGWMVHRNGRAQAIGRGGRVAIIAA